MMTLKITITGRYATAAECMAAAVAVAAACGTAAMTLAIEDSIAPAEILQRPLTLVRLPEELAAGTGPSFAPGARRIS
jgi:hypothetical protein